MSVQINLALRYLWGRKLRTILTTLAVMLGVMVVFGMSGIIPAVEGSFKQGLLAATDQVDVVVSSETNDFFDQGLVQTVAGTDGVSAATGMLSRLVVLPAKDAYTLSNGQVINSLMLIGLDMQTFSNVRELEVVSGRMMSAEDENVILFPTYLADDIAVKVGDQLTLPSSDGAVTVEVIGLVNAPSSPGVNMVYLPLKTTQRILNAGGQVNTIEAMLTIGADRDAVRKAIMDQLGPEYKLGGIESGSEWAQTLQMASQVMSIFGIMAVLMGGFIIFITFRTVVVERRHDIGMLRALGASRKLILGLFVTEGLIQGVIGTFLGLISGYFLIVGMLNAIAPIWEDMVRMPLAEPRFTLSSYLLSIGLGIGVTLLSAYIPARSAARISPLEALRPSAPEVGLKENRRRWIIGAVLILLAVLAMFSGNANLATLGAVLFLIGLLMVGPLLVLPVSNTFGGLLTLIYAREGQIARSNLIRQPGRAAITASVMMISLAIMVALVSLVTTMNLGVFGYVDMSMGSDFLVMPQSLILNSGNVGAGPELLQSVREIPGIGSAASLRVTSLQVGGKDVNLIGIDPVAYPEVGGLIFANGKPEQAYADMAAGDAVVVNGMFKTQSQKGIGDSLTLMTPEGERTYRIAAIGTDFLNMKIPAVYISQENLARDFHLDSDVLIMANLAEGADSKAVETAITDTVSGFPAFNLFVAGEWSDLMKRDMQASLQVVNVLIIALAIPSLIALANTLGINVLERTREIGMLRAVGATRRQVRRIIVAESLLLAMMGTALGIFAGLWLGYVLTGALGAFGLMLEFVFPWMGVVVTVATGLLFGVLAALIPARQAANLDIVAALQYE